MKVFAHYFESPETKNQYRWRTLLQFGTSWEVIGSVVMKNPGAAHPQDEYKRPIEDEETLRHLHLFSPDYPWYEYTDDKTIRYVEYLFRAYYETQLGNPNLNGIIQIFNLINLCETNAGNARKKFKEEMLPFSKTVDKDITQLIAPVYLGFGDWRGKAFVRKDAERLFHVVYNEMNGKYLHADYNANSFIHPQSMLEYRKNSPSSKYILHAFCQNTEDPSF